MTLHLYNGLSQRMEPLLLPGRTASLYVCGITPYDTTHLGHAFTYCIFDVLVRYLEWQGVTVRYVQNVTDVDDDILRRARELDEDWRALGDRWVRRFIDDMEALNVRPPDHYSRASDLIGEIIAAIEVLLARGHAYVRGGSVYYRARFAAFGSLSRLPPGDWLRIAGERGNVPDDPNKEDPLDFVLWQAQAPGEPAWPSPWGPGRPGWHIECSTMANLLLGPTIDIHGGGADLAFPHHEGEVAQAEACTGQRPFARFWLHVAMVRHRGAKMSKSLGNMVMVAELLQAYTPDALRLYLHEHHYRDPWTYDAAGLQQAAARAGRWQAASRAEGASVGVGAAQACTSRVQAALEDDLHTPQAVQALDELAEAILSQQEAGGDGAEARETLVQLAGILGLRLAQGGPEASVIAGWEAHRARFGAQEARG